MAHRLPSSHWIVARAGEVAAFATLGMVGIVLSQIGRAAHAAQQIADKAPKWVWTDREVFAFWFVSIFFSVIAGLLLGGYLLVRRAGPPEKPEPPRNERNHQVRRV